MSRSRYRWNEATKCLEQIASDTSVTPRLELATGSFYESAGQATDGTDISSRKKHAEYCRRNGVVPTAEIASSVTRATEQLQAFREGRQSDPALREAIGRSLYNLEKKGRR